MAASDDPLYSAIGRAVTSWQMVEEALMNLFSSCIRLGTGAAESLETRMLLGGLFYTPNSTETRVSLTDFAVKQTLATNGEILAEWKACKATIQDRKVVRNALAHSQVWGPDGGPLSDLAPSIFYAGRGRQGYSADEINEAGQAFRELATRIEDLRLQAERHLAQR